MKFQGSKMVRIRCVDCGKESDPVCAYLYIEDGGELYGIPEAKLAGWTIVDEAELYSGVSCGLCPECAKES